MKQFLSLRVAALFFCVAGILLPGQMAAATAVQYLDLQGGGGTAAIVADSVGNLYAAATTTGVYDRSRIRIIKTDPQGRTVSSFVFGGSGTDTPARIRIAPNGNIVIAGTTTSADFPVTKPIIAMVPKQSAFVTVVDPELKGIVFSTILGGSTGAAQYSGLTTASGLAIDSAGAVYVAGWTSAQSFPVTAGALQTQPPPGDAFGTGAFSFVSKIDIAGGQLLYSTLFGGTKVSCLGGSSCIGMFANTGATALAITRDGSAVIAGSTSATDLPAGPGETPGECGCSNLSRAGFVAKLAPNGSRVTWSRYVPPGATLLGALGLSIQTMALDGSENVVIGGTASLAFGVTTGALQTTFPATEVGIADYAGFVSKLDAAGKQTLFATFLGNNSGANENGVRALAVDAQGTIWATGASRPDLLPLAEGAAKVGPSYLVGISTDGTRLLDAVTAPRLAAGQDVLVTGQGVVAALGTRGSILLHTSAPGITLSGVTNAAENSVRGEVAPYELVSFFGSGIGPAQPVTGVVENGALTTSLGGTRVLFDGVPAPLLYAGPTQINAIVPAAVQYRTATTVEIVTATGTTTGPVLHVTPARPGVFRPALRWFNGPDMAVALNQDGTVNSSDNPAGRGTIVTIWATGAGISFGTAADGIIVGTSRQEPVLPVSILTSAVQEGLRSLEVLYAGDATGMVKGVLQVNFRLPSNSTALGGQIQANLQVGGAISDTFGIWVQGY